MLIATVPNLVRAGDTETVLVTIQKDNIGVARSVPVTVSFKNADDSLIAEETINIQEGTYCHFFIVTFFSHKIVIIKVACFFCLDKLSSKYVLL